MPAGSEPVSTAAAPVGGGQPPLSALLRVKDISVRFGGIVVLNDVSFTLAPGMICGLIGPNGAGKTTLLNCLSQAGDVLTRENIMSLRW